jgi:isopentenyl diphosphate isomerase/L-lactate dehydrogenase-like FMN-dependent dehydrogenase
MRDATKVDMRVELFGTVYSPIFTCPTGGEKSFFPDGELKLVMSDCGTRTVTEITRAYVATPDWRM